MSGSGAVNKMPLKKAYISNPSLCLKSRGVDFQSIKFFTHTLILSLQPPLASSSSSVSTHKLSSSLLCSVPSGLCLSFYLCCEIFSVYQTLCTYLLHLLCSAERTELRQRDRDFSMGGSLGYLWDLFVKEHKYKKKRQFNTVDLKIKMDCDGCELRIKKTLSNMKGFLSFFQISFLLPSIFFFPVE